MPERRVSSDRDIWPSCVFGERLSEMARWRSRSESLMWSARRNSWGGFVVDMAVDARRRWRTSVERRAGSGEAKMGAASGKSRDSGGGRSDGGQDRRKDTNTRIHNTLYTRTRMHDSVLMYKCRCLTLRSRRVAVLSTHYHRPAVTTPLTLWQANPVMPALSPDPLPTAQQARNDECHLMSDV
jgi:hypothetical protein